MAFLTTAQQNKLKELYPEIKNWNFERYTYGVSKGDIGETAYKINYKKNNSKRIIIGTLKPNCDKSLK